MSNSRPTVVIIAVQNGVSHSSNGDEYYFNEGDTGLLNWNWNLTNYFLEPFVTWDNDPQQVQRKICFPQVMPIGLQKEDCRVIINFAQTR
jgi:hypothetical protein